MDADPRVDELIGRVAALTAEVELLKARPELSENLVMCVFSGDLDRLIAAFIIALGATAYDMPVDLFFTFWGISALRDAKKHAKKDLMGTLFGAMLPKGSEQLPLSQMNMAGVGAKMIRGLMASKGVRSLESMIQEAGELGVRVHVCEMSMRLLGISASELIDYPNLDICGVGSFISLTRDSRQTLFI